MTHVRSPGGAAARINQYESGGSLKGAPELLAGIRCDAVDMEGLEVVI